MERPRSWKSKVPNRNLCFGDKKEMDRRHLNPSPDSGTWLTLFIFCSVAEWRCRVSRTPEPAPRPALRSTAGPRHPADAAADSRYGGVSAVLPPLLPWDRASEQDSAGAGYRAVPRRNARQEAAGGERRGKPGRCLWKWCRPVAKEGRGSTGKNLNPVIRIRLSNFCGENASG